MQFLPVAFTWLDVSRAAFPNGVAVMATAAAKKKKAKSEQGVMFPDLDAKKDADLIAAAEEWIEICAERKETLEDSAKQEREARKAMTAIAKKKGLFSFKVGDVRIDVTEELKAKMKIEKDGKAAESDDESTDE